MNSRIFKMLKNDFSQKQIDKEIAKAILALTRSKNFVLIVQNEEGGEAISCIDNYRNFVSLAYGCHEMEKQLLKAVKEIGDDEL